MLTRRQFGKGLIQIFGAGTLGSFARVSVRDPGVSDIDAAMRIAAEEAVRDTLINWRDDGALAELARELLRENLAELGMTLDELVRTMARESLPFDAGDGAEQLARELVALFQDDAALAAEFREALEAGRVAANAHPAATTPDPRDAVGLPCVGCGRLLTRADASYERQQRHDLRYPAVGRWLAWTDAGWLCARCAYPPRVRRAVQFVPGIANRWIVDVDGWLVEKRRGTLPGVELGDGAQ